MIYPFDFHTHTTYCDGKDTPETMVKSALNKGLKAIGFSGHSYTEFDKDYCMSPDNTKKYIHEIKSLKEKYCDKIEIYCGIELDYYSDIDTSDFDYIIGSVHYCKVNNEYLAVDLNADSFKHYAENFYSGDYYKFCRDYYEKTADIYNKTHCDIIGHFDLITKFNEHNHFFDESDKKYIYPAIEAVDELLKNDVIFEINTGAVSRGYKTKPYPAKFILKRICENGGSIILSGDTHSADTLCYDFNNTAEYIKYMGFKTVKILNNNEFIDYKI